MESNPEHIYLTSQNLALITGGQWFHLNGNLSFTGVASHGIIGNGNVSFAIAIERWRNENVDVEKELLKIYNKGAVAIVVDRKEYPAAINRPMLVVGDVNEAVRKVAILIRQIVNPKTVLVAGSVGKTGFKTQLRHVLQPIVKTHAVINSANVKLPILYSLSSLRRADRVEIVEVSGAARYEIGVERSLIVNPDLVVFTSSSPNHMRVHKTLANFFKAKASAVTGIRSGGTCIVNGNAEYCAELLAAIKSFRDDITIITFGVAPGTAFIVSKYFNKEKYGWDIKAQIEDEIVQYFTPLIQSHAPAQSVGVLLAVKQLGYDVQQAAANYLGLETFETMGRLFEIETNDHKKILFYDQSLRGAIEGMRSAFNDLHNLKSHGRLIVVLGGTSVDEDGEFTRLQHEQIAVLVNNSPIDRLYTTGPYLDHMVNKLDAHGRSIHIGHSDDRKALVARIQQEIEDGDLLFVMGSTYLKLTDVSKAILGFGEAKQLA